MTPKQQRFVQEYLIDLNATQAAIRAGYSQHTADVQGSRLLSNVKVQRVIAARMSERSKRTEVAADRVLLEIARIGFSDLRRLFYEDGRPRRPEEWDADTAASIASFETATRELGEGAVEYAQKIKLWDKVKALDQLSKHLGLYRDQRPPERSGDHLFSDLSDQDLAERLLDEWARVGPAIEREARRCKE